MNSLRYKIEFEPHDFYCGEDQSSTGIKHYKILMEPGIPVALAFDKNIAQTICFALDLTKAILNGDKQKQKDLISLLENSFKI